MVQFRRVATSGVTVGLSQEGNLAKRCPLATVGSPIVNILKKLRNYVESGCVYLAYTKTLNHRKILCKTQKSELLQMSYMSVKVITLWRLWTVREHHSKTITLRLKVYLAEHNILCGTNIYKLYVKAWRFCGTPQSLLRHTVSKSF